MKRSLQSFQYNFCSSLLITFQLVYQLGNRLGSVDVSRSATGYDTLFNSCSCSIQGILHTEFCFFHLGLSSSTYTDNSYAASQFSQSLLQFLFIEFGSGLLDSCFDLSDTILNVLLVASAVNDNGGLFLNFN